MILRKPDILKRNAKIVDIAIIVVASPFLFMISVALLPMIAIHFIVQGKRFLFGPRKDFQNWYAWHPVKIRDNFGFPAHWVWLEVVARRCNGGYFSGETFYITPKDEKDSEDE